MEPELTRAEKEGLIRQIADVLLAGVLNRQDAAEILDVCIRACRRERGADQQESVKTQ